MISIVTMETAGVLNVRLNLKILLYKKKKQTFIFKQHLRVSDIYPSSVSNIQTSNICVKWNKQNKVAFSTHFRWLRDEVLG